MDQQHHEILNSIQILKDDIHVLDELGNMIQDVVAIVTISLHFVGNPLHLKEKNIEFFQTSCVRN